MLKILMVASEVAPYAKTGGLADVIGSLPQALRALYRDEHGMNERSLNERSLKAQDLNAQNLNARGCDVRVVMPHYAAIDARRFPAQSLARVHFRFDNSQMAAEIQRFGSLQESSSTDVPVYGIESPRYFRREKLYGYDDDILRFGFFCRACLELPRTLDWKPDIIHCHDWHAGLLPVYLRAMASDLGLRGTRTVFSIHNLAYQGLAAHEYLERLGLDASLWNMHQLEYFGRLNPMKGGLVFSDALTTVSPRYAREIQTPQFGEGLEGVLRARATYAPSDLRGILNGIDYSQWNPQDDAHIAAHYDATSIGNKRICKRDLLHRMDLGSSEPAKTLTPAKTLLSVPFAQQNAAPRASSAVLRNEGREAARAAKTKAVAANPAESNELEDAPLIGMVSRLSSQKGFDLIAEAMPEIVALGCRFVLLGNGDEKYLRIFGALGERFERDTSMNLGRFNDDLAHRIYAGSDFFLMPSLYEPCGLGQMLALSYGTIPIVRETGGLADTVFEYDAARNVGNGFVFHDASAPAMLEAIKRALHCYRSPAWPRLVRNALACDYSWDASAARYEELYREVVAR